LADLLSIPTSERYPPLNLTPKKRKEKTLQALLGYAAPAVAEAHGGEPEAWLISSI
jgi:hypothetical protein